MPSIVPAAPDTTLADFVVQESAHLWPLIIVAFLYVIGLLVVAHKFGLAEFPRWRGWRWNGK